MRDTFGFPAYFDGDTDRWDSAQFEWEGTPHQSRSLCRTRSYSSWSLTSNGAYNFAHSVLGRETRDFFRGRDRVGFAYVGSLMRRASGEVFSVTLGVYGSDENPSTPAQLEDTAASVEPNVTYSASISTGHGAAGRTGLTVRTRAFIVWRDEDGEVISRSNGAWLITSWIGGHVLGDYSPQIETHSVSDESPAGAAYASVGAEVTSIDGSPLLPSMTFLADTAILAIGERVPDYFDGATPDDSTYTYEWEGDPDSSASLRIGETVRTGPGPIIDPSCPPPPEAPAPPQLAMGCGSSTEEWRRVWYILPEEEVYEWGAVIPSFTVTSGDAPIDDLRITIWENPGGVAPQDFDQEQQYVARWHVSYLPEDTAMTLDGTTRTITASLSGSAPRDAAHLVTGPGNGPVLWAKLTCGEGYLVAVDTPLGDDPENTSLSMSLTREFG